MGKGNTEIMEAIDALRPTAETEVTASGNSYRVRISKRGAFNPQVSAEAATLAEAWDRASRAWAVVTEGGA